MRLMDSQQRAFAYLRLSVTDRCNFSCVYCLPNGYQPSLESRTEAELSVEEIRRLVAGFAQMGVTKVRLTGGEPTVRRDIVEIASAVASTGGVEKVAITTNGGRLAELALPLREAGVTAVNVSIDSLDAEKFRKITGTDRLGEIKRGIDRALEVGFENVKVNAVLLKDCNDVEVGSFMEWVRDRPVSVRFIELMRTGKNGDFFGQRHLSAGKIRLDLLKAGWTQAARSLTDGPAVVFEHSSYRGSIGLIAPYSQDFCVSCNRLRVSARGALRLCLFGEKDESLRPYLADDGDRGELMTRVRELLREKAPSHLLHEGKYGNTWNLAGIGG